MSYDTETQTPTDEQIKRIEDEIKKCTEKRKSEHKTWQSKN